MHLLVKMISIQGTVRENRYLQVSAEPWFSAQSVKKVRHYTKTREGKYDRCRAHKACKEQPIGVYYGRIKDAFAPIIKAKIEAMDGEVVGTYYAPDDESFIESRLRELLNAGADLLITTGGMSVDPDDVTRFAIRNIGVEDITYGSAVLPGAMFLVTYLGDTPILGIPACGMYAKTTIFDLILPRVLAGEKVGRKDLAELGHGGLCMKCGICNYPVCPFGK